MLQQTTEKKTSTEHALITSTVAGVEASISERLSAHEIEAELLGTCPRQIKRSLVGRDLIAVVIIPSLALSFWDVLMVPVHHKNILENWVLGLVALFGLSFGIGSWISEARQAIRRKNLLRHGQTVPAVVTDLRPVKLGQHMEYAYQTLRGDILFRSLVIPINTENLQIGSTFTVLVAPKDERRVMPYFLAGEYRVVNHD